MRYLLPDLRRRDEAGRQFQEEVDAFTAEYVEHLTEPERDACRDQIGDFRVMVP